MISALTDQVTALAAQMAILMEEKARATQTENKAAAPVTTENNWEKTPERGRKKSRGPSQIPPKSVTNPTAPPNPYATAHPTPTAAAKPPVHQPTHEQRRTSLNSTKRPAVAPPPRPVRTSAAIATVLTADQAADAMASDERGDE